MAAIDSDSYDTIQGLYAEAARQIQGVSDYYYQAAYEVVLLQQFDPEIDLLQPMYNSWQSAITVYDNVPLSTIEAVRRLQRHVVNRASVSSINTWLTSNGVQVEAEFAELSDAAGFPITCANIRGCT
jgi:hypothetical protein